MPDYRELAEDIRRGRIRLIQGIFAVLVAYMLFEGLRASHDWHKIKGEGNLWNYVSSLQYFAAGQAALAVALLLRYCSRLRDTATRPRQWIPWAAAGAAFIFFACDEMLMIHERLGSRLEEVAPWLASIYPGHADNLIIGVYGLGAVLFTLVFFRGAIADRRARAYYIAGFAMMGMTVLMDVVPRDLYVGYLPFRETEEFLELFAGFSFTAAFISTGASLLVRILDVHAAGTERSTIKEGTLIARIA